VYSVLMMVMLSVSGENCIECTVSVQCTDDGDVSVSGENCIECTVSVQCTDDGDDAC